MSRAPVSSVARVSRNLGGTVNTLSLPAGIFENVDEDPQAEALEQAAVDGVPLCAE